VNQLATEKAFEKSGKKAVQRCATLHAMISYVTQVFPRCFIQSWSSGADKKIGSLAMLLALRLASSRVSSLSAEHR